MDNFQHLRRTVILYLFLAFFLLASMLTAGWWIGINVLHLHSFLIASGSLTLAFIVGCLLAIFIGRYILEPLHVVWQAIVHIAPGISTVQAPNLEKVRLGRELVTTLVTQVYQFASQQDSKEQATRRKEMLQAATIVSRFPLPLFVFNKDQLVTNASDSALSYCQLESATLFGKPLFDNLNLEFSNERTLEAWIKDCQQNKVTDTEYWQHIRVRLPSGEEVRQCDMAAYYNRDNPSGTEFIVTLFDHTEDYNKDDQSLSFVAIAVHELRTPLTILRGYVEVFEDELGEKLDDEMKDFMHKMRVSSDQLSAFVNNILNVARVEENQLVLHLTEENWDNILREAAGTMELHAKVHGKTFEYQIDANLPSVGVDRVSILEVVDNLLDNAIKYSDKSDKIILKSALNKAGMVETSIQDFGVGIPTSVLSNLFEKFYRNHRTRGQIGGTGLGLYLCKAIVSAHGGQIWVKSKEGEGSTFGFTLQPYKQLAAELKKGNNTDIVRQAHGWIKNHSLYRK